MDHHIVERVKALIKENQLLLKKPQQPDKTRTILHILGNLQACIALLANEIQTLHKMHVGLERGFVEVEELVKGIGGVVEQAETTDWKMKDPEWEDDFKEPYSREGDSE